MERLEAALARAGARLAYASHTFDGANPTGVSRVGRPEASAGNASSSSEERRLPTSDGGGWRIETSAAELKTVPEGIALEVRWHRQGEARGTAAEVRFEFGGWSESVYVLVPGAVYNGNRFESRRLEYAPCWSRLSERGPDVPALVTDVPRLSAGPGPSAFHLMTGDAATPAVGLFDPRRRQGCLIVTEPRTSRGETSIHVEESEDRSEAIVSFRAPGVRPVHHYEMCTTEAPSPDRGADFEDGDAFAMRFGLYVFPCDNVPALFAALAQVRLALSETVVPQAEPTGAMLPFSAAWDIQEDKYNRLNWNGAYGYYAVGTVDRKHQDWQLGWVGGGLSSYALLLEGRGESASRAERTIDFMLGGQTAAGFFPGVFYRGSWYGDEFNDDPRRDAPEQWHLVRKSADALYFLGKHLQALRLIDPQRGAPAHWIEGTRRLADAFAKLWDAYGQFGQWVNHDTGELFVGGSAGGATAVAGLALAGRILREPAYLSLAREAGAYYYEQFTAEGLTTGGPGEILQCPDSESAFALLEAFVALYETTGEREWLARAEEAADQCLSWCVSYDYAFPPDSTFGRLGIGTTGSVIANVQNKHSAPGICTLSGDSLFRLFRATGRRRYLEQLGEIARHLPQYLSREDRPIRGWDGEDLPPGYMSERVNMSDWEGKELVGEALPLSCWPEVSLMLTYAEVPGIYAQPEAGLLWVADNVVASLESKDGALRLRIENPTPYPASVKLLVETSAEAARPLGPCASLEWPRIAIGPGKTRTIPLAP